MARPKKTVDFPDVCCGVCSYCVPDEDETGICYAMPPQLIEDEGSPCSARPIVSFDSPECVYFKPRLHG